MDKITVGSIARELGVSSQAVYKWLNGDEVTPLNLAKALHLTAKNRLEALDEQREFELKKKALAEEIYNG